MDCTIWQGQSQVCTFTTALNSTITWYIPLQPRVILRIFPFTTSVPALHTTIHHDQSGVLHNTVGTVHLRREIGRTALCNELCN
jgi:hypothetical protein